MSSVKKELGKTIVMLSFVGSLLAFGISSYAWFLKNETGNGSGLSTKVDVDTNLVDIDFKLYKYDRDEKTGVEYNQGSEGFDLVLNDFDNFIRERNDNNNNIIRFHVTLPNSAGSTAQYRTVSVSATIKTTNVDDPFEGGFTDRQRRTHNDTTGYKYHNNNKSADFTCNNISNIIYFKGFMYSYSIYDEETKQSTEHKLIDTLNFDDESTADEVYKGVTAEFKKIENKFSFVEDGNKNGNIQFSMDQIPAKTSELVFFVEYNYNIDLIDEFLTNTEIVSGAQDSSILANKIVFMKDIESIKISSSEVK